MLENNIQLFTYTAANQFSATSSTSASTQSQPQIAKHSNHGAAAQNLKNQLQGRGLKVNNSLL